MGPGLCTCSWPKGKARVESTWAPDVTDSLTPAATWMPVSETMRFTIVWVRVTHCREHPAFSTHIWTFVGHCCCSEPISLSLGNSNSFLFEERTLLGLVVLCISVPPHPAERWAHDPNGATGRQRAHGWRRLTSGWALAVGAHPVCFSHLNWFLSFASKEPRPGAEGEREEEVPAV